MGESAKLGYCRSVLTQTRSLFLAHRRENKVLIEAFFYKRLMAAFDGLIQALICAELDVFNFTRELSKGIRVGLKFN